MKKIIIILSLAFLVITFAMFSLVKRGVGLRANTLISASEIETDDKNVGPSVAQRLFPDFQNSEIVIIGWPEGNERLSFVADQILITASQLLKQPITLAKNKMDLKNCLKLCVVKVSDLEAQELEVNSYIEKVIQPLGRTYFTLNLNTFQRTDFQANSDQMSRCETEKFLDFQCLKLISIRDSLKKMKLAEKKYFFLRKYQDRGHYLFLESL